MSQWHHARGGRGRGGRDYAARPPPKKKGGNHIPERWTDYLPVGQRMPGTRFIAFKVPLQKHFEVNLAPEEYFSPSDLFNKVQEQKEELGLVIDLTYTQRYYKPEDLPEAISYIKIFTVGHQVPSDDTIFKFKCAVKEFLKENKDNDKLIGVHCTHGLNRTGYLICRYLIDVEGMRPDDAIELFNRCRGHCIERQNYIANLRKGPVRKSRNLNPNGNWNPNTATSAALEAPAHPAADRRSAANRPVSQRPRTERAGGNPPARCPQAQTPGWQQPFRKFSQNPGAYYRSHIPPPGPAGENYSQRRYVWNVKPGVSRAAQNRKWFSPHYQRLSCPTSRGWTE